MRARLGFRRRATLAAGSFLVLGLVSLAPRAAARQGPAGLTPAELQALERRAAISGEALGELGAQLTGGNDEVAVTARNLMVARDRLGDRRDVLHRRLRNIYKRGPLNSMQVLLSAESFGDLINRYKYLFLIARHDRRLVQEVAQLEYQLATRERQLDQTLAEIRDAQTEGSMALDQLDALRGGRTPVRPAAASAAPTAAAARRERDERTLRSVLTGLERARTAPAEGSATRVLTLNTLTSRDLGALPWPVQGDLAYRFGSPFSQGASASGIGIRAPAGTPVRTIEEGRVVMADLFEGFGSTVLVSHGGGYYSLYLHLQSTSVRDGDPVGRQAVVGTVGGAGTAEGSHVELQIRAPGGAAVDPLPWLQGGGQ